MDNKQNKNNKNNKNIKNPESPLFKSLTKLFSGPLVNFHQQAQIRFRRRDLNKFNFNSATGKQFQKSSYNPFDAIQANIMANQTRAERYSDFDQMEYTPEIASTLDIYADEMTTHSSMSKMLHIKSSNQEIRGILESLYYDILNIEFNLFGWCRTMCKFGDMFLYLDIDPELGIKNVIGLPSPEIERLEGQDKTNPKYVQFQWNSGGLTFENWQIAHFRVLGQDKYTPYGTSVLEPARRIWRQLNLLEDAMMAYRIVRAPDRRVFYIDIGNIAPEDIEQYMLKIQSQMKRNMIVDPNTGRVDLRYNPMSIDEDYFVPVRGGTSSTRIDTLQGGTFASAIDDVKYLRDKLFSALKIPQSYLARDEKASEDKTTLAQKDIRFARTVQRLQRVLIAELEKIGIIHLYTLGYRNEDLLNFSISLNNPSKISELQELEHWKTKFEVASQAKEDYFSKRWISENIFNLSELEFKKIQREIYYDKQFTKSLEQVGAAAPEGGGPPAGGGDLGGSGPEATPPPTPPPAEEGTPSPEAPLSVDQLSAPAKRKDTGPDMRSSMSKSVSSYMRSEANPEGASRTTARTMIPGYESLASLYETTNYSTEAEDINEKKLHEVNQDIKNLLTSLEKKNAKQKRETKI